MKAVFAIALTEIRIGIRNSWVLLSAGILAVFSILLVLLGSAPSGVVDAHPLTVAVASLSTLAVYLIPLIALLLSFDAVAGEVDRGTLQLVLATPVARWQVLFGKFIGHTAVLTIAIVAGYGIAGILGYTFGGADGYEPLACLLSLVATSVLLCAVFVAVGYLASCFVRQTGTAAALAVGIWLATVVLYDMALLGGLLVSHDGIFARTIFPWLLLLNPADAFRVYNMAVVDGSLLQTGLGTGASGLPLEGSGVLLSPVLWCFAALGLAALAFRRVTP